MLTRLVLIVGLLGWCAATAITPVQVAEAAAGAAAEGPAAASEAGAAPDADSAGLEECLKQDSISCVQKQVFRSVKAFFDQESIDLFGGVSLVKEPAAEGARAAPRDEEEAGRVLGDGDVSEREEALEAFTVRKAGSFLQERSLRLDLSPVVKSLTERARALVATIPPEVRQRVVDFAAAEGRGKKKKLQKILPLLMLGGLKIAGLAALKFLAIGLIAKKAILLSLVSLAISTFIGLKKLLSQQHHGSYHEVHHEAPVHGWSGGGYSSPGGSFDVSSYSGGHGEYGSHSQPVGHAIAYSAHKPGSR